MALVVLEPGGPLGASERESSQSKYGKICLPAIPGNIFGVEETCHNLKDAIHFFFV